MRSAALALLLAGLAAGPAPAADAALVTRFARLSDAALSNLSRSEIGGLDATASRARAECILAEMDRRHGREGVQALMSMMAVLARGVQFDDQTVVDFNARFGRDYNRIESDCTRAAQQS